MRRTFRHTGTEDIGKDSRGVPAAKQPLPSIRYVHEDSNRIVRYSECLPRIPCRPHRPHRPRRELWPSRGVACPSGTGGQEQGCAVPGPPRRLVCTTTGSSPSLHACMYASMGTCWSGTRAPHETCRGRCVRLSALRSTGEEAEGGRETGHPTPNPLPPLPAP